ncbi:hypothetical protein O181_018228 [Austropuccinia psidii MF-1]|uniref:Importin N-terminal domain-containing protein n=1 Tax=Austropuccinia psidii MF-1 TaxID=1389203 RepID=A0A9Q3C8N7_9BASI|nr:hypothetical protein [Austropuccinia psidii MF-1]
MDLNCFLEYLHVLYPPSSTPPHLFPTQEQQARAQKAVYDLIADHRAWLLASQILDSLDVHDWAKDSNVRFIAAQTLAVKISRDWSSLPQSEHLSLKGKLLYWLQASANRLSSASVSGEKIVLRKLAVAISALSFVLVPEPEKCWDNWLLEVISGISSMATTPIPLLEVLTVIAEEAERASLVGAQRSQYHQSIQDSGGLVIRSLVDSLASGCLSTKLAAINCSQAWLCSSHLNVDGPLSLWPILVDLLFNSPYLVSYINPNSFHDLPSEQEELVQKVADCIEELVSGSNGGASMGGGFVSKTRAEPLLDWFGGDLLGSLIQQSITSGEMPDAILSVIKLFVSLTEHSISFLAANLNAPRSLRLLNYLLQLSTFPGFSGIDENVSSLALPIWTLLQEELNDLGYLGNPQDELNLISQPSTVQGVSTELRSFSSGLFRTVFQGIKKKCTWPTHKYIVSNWTKDMINTFKNHTRIDLGECLLSCYYVYRDEMLADLVNEVKALLAKGQAPEDCYEDLEACLFCIRAIQDGIQPLETTSLPILFSPEILGKIPQGQTPPLERLKGTSLSLVGAFAEWFKFHPDHLLCSLDLIAPSLNSHDPELVSLAANALKILCDTGRKTLVNHIAPLAELIRSTEGKIMPDEYNKVLQAVASVLQALPSQQLARPILSLIRPVLTRLSQALQFYSQTRDPEDRVVIVNQLQQLKACNKGLSEPDEDVILLDADDSPGEEKRKRDELSRSELLCELRSDLSRLVCYTLELSIGDTDIAIAAAELLRSCTSNMLPTAISLDPLLILTNCTHNIAHDRINLAIWFSLCTSLITATRRFQGRHLPPDQYDVIAGCVKESVKVASTALNTDTAMRQEPELAQTFLRFCISIIEAYGELFQVLRAELEMILSIAIAGLQIEERITLHSVFDILRLYVQQTQNSSSAQAELFLYLISTYGAEILNQIMLGIGGKLPRSSLPGLSETLHCFLIKIPGPSRGWLSKLLETPHYPSSKITLERKARFLKSICAARTLKKAKDICAEFAIFIPCRLIYTLSSRLPLFKSYFRDDAVEWSGLLSSFVMIIYGTSAQACARCARLLTKET